MERASLDVLNVRASGIEEVRLWSLAGAKGVILLTTPLLGSGEEGGRESVRRVKGLLGLNPLGLISRLLRGQVRPLLYIMR
jgi:hypothetical protein